MHIGGFNEGNVQPRAALEQACGSGNAGTAAADDHHVMHFQGLALWCGAQRLCRIPYGFSPRAGATIGKNWSGEAGQGIGHFAGIGSAHVAGWYRHVGKANAHVPGGVTHGGGTGLVFGLTVWPVADNCAKALCRYRRKLFWGDLR